jgi:hypothetical protein
MGVKYNEQTWGGGKRGIYKVCKLSRQINIEIYV